MFQPNEQKIVRAITSSPISPSAKEVAGELVEAWINENGEFDSQYESVAVEVPWYYWIQPKTAIIGVMDRLAKDKQGIFGCEWKTAKEPQQNADGRDSAWWNEEVWLEGISTGTQLSIYALAMNRGIFAPVGGKKFKINSKFPRIMVRAAVKSNPARFWPTEREDGIFQFSKEYLDIVEQGLISKATQIRSTKLLKIIPWALPGNHCYNRFRKECPYHQGICLKHEHPALEDATDIFDSNDPGSGALVAAGVPALAKDPELLVFSASSYDTSQQCPEKYRILVGGYGKKESDANLDIGTGVHAGVAEYYRQEILNRQIKNKPLDIGRKKK